MWGPWLSYIIFTIRFGFFYLRFQYFFVSFVFSVWYYWAKFGKGVEMLRRIPSRRWGGTCFLWFLGGLQRVPGDCSFLPLFQEGCLSFVGCRYGLWVGRFLFGFVFHFSFVIIFVWRAFTKFWRKVVIPSPLRESLFYFKLGVVVRRFPLTGPLFSFGYSPQNFNTYKL